jgi:transcriptional regulator with XRE-family HTH domain
VGKNKIAQLRNAKGFSQSQLADIMEVGKQTIANWENDRREPDIESLYRLSEVFGTTIDYILGNTSKSGREWYVNMDCVNDECMEGNYICRGVPEAVVIAKALKRMNLEQRNRLLDICHAAFPEEFYDLVHHKWDDEQKEGL